MLFLCLFIVSLYNIQKHCARSMESNVDLLYYGPEPAMNLDLEKQLRSKLARKKKSEERLRQLNERIAKDTEYFEEIPHFAVNSSKNIRSKPTHYENAFKKIVGMAGVIYTYKRDLHWRAWREVTYPNKKKEVICYRCQNIMNVAESNCTSCHYGGFWVIEDAKPPCSYEIFSYKNDELCVAYFWQLNQAKLNSCPTVIPFNKLSDCHFPIVTNYVVTMDYSKKASERSLPAICQGREECDFSTVYIVRTNNNNKLNPESIVFRIINTTNNIIYSRIMKRGKKNYVCVDDCGIFNFGTMTGKRNEEHLLLNLLQPNKKKRANPRPKNRQSKKQKKIKIPASKDAFNYIESKGAFSRNDLLVKKHHYNLEQPLDRKSKATPRHTTQSSLCKQILLKELLHDMKDDNFLFDK